MQRHSVEHPVPVRVSDPESSGAGFRSHLVLAVGSGVPASVPALILTGSLAVCVLVAVLTVVCVGLAALMI